MMKKVSKWLVAAAVLPLSLSAASAWAFGGPNGGHGGKCGGDRAVLKQLDLTEEQQAHLKELREANKAQREERKANRDVNQAERDAHKAQMKALMLSDSFDQAAAQELASTMVEKQTQRRVAMMEKKHEMLQILTPEQREQFIDAQEERMQECKAKMDKKKQRKAKSNS